MEYKIIWEIDIEANDETKAIKQAKEIQLDPKSIATVFKIKPLNSKEEFKTVDLHETEPYITPDKCPKCGSYGDALSSDFGDFYGSRKFRCTNCPCEWETQYVIQATNQTIDCE